MFTDKMNIISMHDEFLFNCSFHTINYQHDMLVLSNQLVYPDTFMAGLKVSIFYGAQVTSCFSLGKVVFSGISCYRSFKKQVINWHLNWKLLKKFFNYYPFLKQVLAMYQCRRCFPCLERFLTFMLTFTSNDERLSNFSLFRLKAHFNSKKIIKNIDMINSFTLKVSYCKGNQMRKVIHSRNGELVHDCYYDIENFNGKVVIMSGLEYYENIECQLEKGVGNESTTSYQILENSYGPEEEVGLSEYDNYLMKMFKLVCGHRLAEYVDWIKKYFDVCMFFFLFLKWNYITKLVMLV